MESFPPPQHSAGSVQSRLEPRSVGLCCPGSCRQPVRMARPPFPTQRSGAAACGRQEPRLWAGDLGQRSSPSASGSPDWGAADSGAGTLPGGRVKQHCLAHHADVRGLNPAILQTAAFDNTYYCSEVTVDWREGVPVAVLVSVHLLVP